MLFNAEKIFDTNETEISEEVGTPESVGVFRERYIEPLFESDCQAGQEIETAFWDALCEYQRRAFTVGFRAAAQLLMGCMPGNSGKE